MQSLQINRATKPLRLGRRALLAGAGALLAATQFGAAFAQDKQVELGFVYWETKTDAFVQMSNGGLAVAALDPRVHLLTAAPDAGDPQQQAALFGPIAQTQVDGIVLQSLAAGPMTRPVMDAMAVGIPVVAIDAPPPKAAALACSSPPITWALGVRLPKRFWRWFRRMPKAPSSSAARGLACRPWTCASRA